VELLAALSVAEVGFLEVLLHPFFDIREAGADYTDIEVIHYLPVLPDFASYFKFFYIFLLIRVVLLEDRLLLNH